jgi:hypothetical protein
LHEVYHKVARRFLEVVGVERVGKGKREKEIFLMEMI